MVGMFANADDSNQQTLFCILFAATPTQTLLDKISHLNFLILSQTECGALFLMTVARCCPEGFAASLVRYNAFYLAPFYQPCQSKDRNHWGMKCDLLHFNFSLSSLTNKLKQAESRP